MAPRLFQKWLLQPLQDLSEIEYRTDLVQYYCDNMPVRQILSAFLRKMPDLDRLLIKLFKIKSKKRSRTKLADCYKLYLVVSELEVLVGFLDNLLLRNEVSEIRDSDEKTSQNEKLQFLRLIFGKHYEEFKKYNEFIEKAIDIESIESRREYLLNPGSTLIKLI